MDELMFFLIGSVIGYLLGSLFTRLWNALTVGNIYRNLYFFIEENIAPRWFGRFFLFRWIDKKLWARINAEIMIMHEGVIRDHAYLSGNDSGGPYLKEASAIMERMNSGETYLEYAYYTLIEIRKQFEETKKY